MKRYDLVLHPFGDCDCCIVQNPGGGYVKAKDALEMREALDLALSCFVGMGFGGCEAAQKIRAVLAKLEEQP